MEDGKRHCIYDVVLNGDSRLGVESGLQATRDFHLNQEWLKKKAQNRRDRDHGQPHFTQNTNFDNGDNNTQRGCATTGG
jgi:hypothetical protein